MWQIRVLIFLAVFSSFVRAWIGGSRFSARLRAPLAMGRTDVMMPALSSTMTEGKIVSWAKNVGDKVEAGEVLLVVESDKADRDVESYDDGYLAAILTEEGDSAPVGKPVALISPRKESIDAVVAESSHSGGARGCIEVQVPEESSVRSNCLVAIGRGQARRAR